MKLTESAQNMWIELTKSAQAEQCFKVADKTDEVSQNRTVF
ncbi:hypothetical protein [Streptococcus pneumoniae]|nr:hypothetical protein [Streptococcus pneumoniae]